MARRIVRHMQSIIPTELYAPDGMDATSHHTRQGTITIPGSKLALVPYQPAISYLYILTCGRRYTYRLCLTYVISPD